MLILNGIETRRGPRAKVFQIYIEAICWSRIELYEIMICNEKNAMIFFEVVIYLGSLC